MSTFNDDTNKFSENTTPEIDDTFHQQLQDELKLLAQNNSQATETEWTEIMDDSNNTIKKQTARTKIFAIAASILLVAVIGGTIFAVANNGDSKAIKTVDDKDKTPVTKPAEETSSTIKTSENTTLDAVLQRVDLANGGYSYDVYTSDLSSKIGSLPTNNQDGFDGEALTVTILNTDGGKIVGARNIQCDSPSGTFVFDIKTGKTEETLLKVRDYSPSGKKYTEYTPDCDGLPYSTFIVDATTGSKRELSPENGSYISDTVWVNDDKLMYNLFDPNNVNSSNWYIADLNKEITFKNQTPILTGSNGDNDLPAPTITDVITENGKSYVLTTQHDQNSGISSVTTYNLDGMNKVWTKEFVFETGYIADRPRLRFIGNSDTIGGAFVDDMLLVSYSYSNTEGTDSFPEGAALIPTDK